MNATYAFRLTIVLALIVFSMKLGYVATAEIGVMILVATLLFGNMTVEWIGEYPGEEDDTE